MANSTEFLAAIHIFTALATDEAARLKIKIYFVKYLLIFYETKSDITREKL